jgi:ABC transporter
LASSCTSRFGAWRPSPIAGRASRLRRGSDCALRPRRLEQAAIDGAGKSTLMQIIAGNFRPRHGSIAIEGRSTTFHKPIDARRARSRSSIRILRCTTISPPPLTCSSRESCASASARSTAGSAPLSPIWARAWNSLSLRAAVGGGANLSSGGAGIAFGAVIGAPLIEVIRNSLLLLGVDAF